LIEIGEQKLIQFIMQDITERKRSERLLQESIEELARSNTELEQFTYIASHDLKEPLRMISSFTQLLEKRYKDKIDEDANDFIKFITEGVVRMQDLINSLLAYSRIGKLSKEFEKIDLNDVLKNVIDNLQQLINETNAEVIYDSLPSLFVDKNQLLQVFQNLISNAIKFHGKESPQVRVSARPDNQCWVFSIRDNGIGIDPKDFERIFIIFQRLHAKDEYDGTGIGLAICKKIIEHHSGKIWVESEVGKGSTFYFSIPNK
jgi:light-regulated signal transduction histidine kinase (bacteriophytochrome)